MKGLKKYRLFQYLVMAYMVAAFAWWAILLSRRNTEIYNLKKEIMVSQNIHDFHAINQEYAASKKMVLGEGLVFAVSILLGLILINRAFWSEINLNRRLNNFLLSVTHELKTPITSINLINRTLATKTLDDNKRKDLLNTAHQESQRLESLVNNILTAAQMESVYEYNFENIDIGKLLMERVDRFQKINASFTFTLDQKCNNGILFGDQEAITKLLDNLIDNSIKYSQEVKKIIISCYESELEFTISVADQGIGIDVSERMKILDKFYRVGSEEIRQTKGTGLGLFIVKQIAEAHNAKINIGSNSPKGTVIKLHFPKSFKA